MKKLLKALSLVLMMSVSVTSFAASGGREFTAKLSGSEVVPPVETQATGSALFTPAGDIVKYRIMTQNLENVTGIHIHFGKKGENGPPVAMIMTQPKNGLLPSIDGKITAKDLAGELRGKDVKALLSEMEKGGAYVNVHTENHPKGEIRGQIGPALLVSGPKIN